MPDLKLLKLPVSEDPFLNRLDQLSKDISQEGNEHYSVILIAVVLDYFQDIDTYEGDLIEQYLTIALHFMEIYFNDIEDLE